MNEIESLFESKKQNAQEMQPNFEEKYETDENYETDEEDIKAARELANKININDRVLYKKAGEPEKLATVLKVIYDDKKPYYSLKLEDGNIRESEHTYIKRIQLVE